MLGFSNYCFCNSAVSLFACKSVRKLHYFVPAGDKMIWWEGLEVWRTGGDGAQRLISRGWSLQRCSCTIRGRNNTLNNNTEAWWKHGGIYLSEPCRQQGHCASVCWCQSETRSSIKRRAADTEHSDSHLEGRPALQEEENSIRWFWVFLRERLALKAQTRWTKTEDMKTCCAELRVRQSELWLQVQTGFILNTHFVVIELQNNIFLKVFIAPII